MTRLRRCETRNTSPHLKKKKGFMYNMKYTGNLNMWSRNDKMTSSSSVCILNAFSMNYNPL